MQHFLDDIKQKNEHFCRGRIFRRSKSNDKDIRCRGQKHPSKKETNKSEKRKET